MGMTILVKTLLEQAGWKDKKLIVLDPEGDYKNIPNEIAAGKQGQIWRYKMYTDRNDEIFAEIKKFAEKKEGRFLEIDWSEYDDTPCPITASFNMWEIQSRARNRQIDIDCGLSYHNRKIVVWRNRGMNYKYTIKIPYGERSKYLDMVYTVNETIEDGIVGYFVNNIPYKLEICLVIETERFHNEVENIITQYHLEKNQEQGVRELVLESEWHKWNWRMLSRGLSKEQIRGLTESLCEFPEKEALEKYGYYIEKKEVRKKVFISYCHADKKRIQNIVEEIGRLGISAWWDMAEIDYGDSIIEKIHEGLRECDLNIIFISKNTKNAMYAKHELNSIWEEIIYCQKQWIVVRLDEVDPNDIYIGLRQYKYLDFQTQNDINELYRAIQKKLK